LIDLTGVNSPTYRTITGRPDGVGGLGIEFSAAQQEYLRGPNLGDPSVSASSTLHSPPGSINYAGIVNRGLQFWVKPQATTAQTLVMDTNQHGARINSSGRFSMRYAGNDFDSTIQATAGTWYHVMVVRPSGAANGSRMYVNGVAAAFGPGGYNVDSSDLVVGANTAGTDANFTGGTAEFFTGIIDDLKLFVAGTTSSGNINYGTFNLATDNEFIASKLTNVAGDLNNDGVLNQTDKNAFIAGWFDKNLVNGFQLGDLNTRAAGDLNFDGTTNILDLAAFQSALTGAGVPAITPAELAAAGVPEPSAVLLVGMGLACFALVQKRKR
jgi:hypothetical protein